MTGTRSQPKHLFATETNPVGANSASLRVTAPNHPFKRLKCQELDERPWHGLCIDWLCVFNSARTNGGAIRSI